MNSTTIKIEEAIDQTYEELKKIGKGGFGAVYRGRHKLTKEYHAIKIQDSKKCKSREVEMLHKYKHSSILPLIFSFITKSQMYMIHPLYESNLSYILKTQMNLGLDMKIKYFQSILNGVYFLHSNNVMHLDIKPANILVTKDGECILADFGLTKENNMGLKTQSTRWITKRYASPERQNNNVPSDFADDVWSLGCVLYEIFENGEIIDVQYIETKTNWVQNGAKYFYDNIFQTTFVERNKRITLENMMRKFKEISIVILDDIPNFEQREIISNYLAEQPEPQLNFGRLFPIEEGKFEDGITEETHHAVPKLEMKEENPFSSQEFRQKIQEFSKCHSNLYPDGFFSDDQEEDLTIVTQVKSIELQEKDIELDEVNWNKVPIKKAQAEAQTELTALPQDTFYLKYQQKKYWIGLIILVIILFLMMAALLIFILIIKKENSNLQDKISDLENINQGMKLDCEHCNIQRDELEEIRGILKEAQSRLSRFNESNKVLKDQLRSMNNSENNVKEELDYYKTLENTMEKVLGLMKDNNNGLKYELKSHKSNQNELLIQCEKDKKYLKSELDKAYQEFYFIHQERNRQIANYKRVDLNYIKLKQINQCNDPKYFMINKEGFWPIPMTPETAIAVSIDKKTHYRGTANSVNSLNYFLAASCNIMDGCPDSPYATYLFNLNDLNQKPMLVGEGSDNSECFFIHDYAAICCDFTGNLQKYEFDSKMNLQPLSSPYRPEMIVPQATHQLFTCIQMEEGLIVTGDNVGYLYIVDDMGYTIKRIPTAGGSIYQVTEVFRGVIIMVQGNKNFTAIDLRDIEQEDRNKYIIPYSIHGDYSYYAITPLWAGGEGSFALAGRTEWNDGFIAILQLFSNLTAGLIKNTINEDRLGGSDSDCVFHIIYEIESGIILVGGVDSCTEVCSWNYMNNPKPTCYPNSGAIYNFISFCNI